MTAAAPSAPQSRALAACAALIFAFLYLPVVVLILYSFNRDGVGGFPPAHLTLDWYRRLFADSAIWDAVLNSLIVAAGAVALSLTLGDFLAPLLVGGPSGTMIANIVQSLFGAAYDWPLGAAISICILLLTVALLFAAERLEKRWTFR